MILDVPARGIHRDVTFSAVVINFLVSPSELDRFGLLSE